MQLCPRLQACVCFHRKFLVKVNYSEYSTFMAHRRDPQLAAWTQSHSSFLQRRASEFHILFPFVKFRYYFISSLMKKGLGQTNGLKLSLKSSDHSQGSERAQNKQRVLFLLLFSKRYEKHEQRNKVKPRALFQRNR